MRMLIPLVALSLCTLAQAHERFEGSFYLDRRELTWVLTFGPNNTIEISGTNGRFAKGYFKANEDHLTIIVGEQKRIFNYDWTGGNLKLGYRDNARVEPKGALAGIPPSRESQNRELFIQEREWLGLGRPKLVAGSAPVPVAPAPGQDIPPAVRPVTPIAVGGKFDDIAGEYYLPAPGNQRELLSIRADGQFDYTPLNGARASGGLSRLGDELLFVGPSHRRSFTVRSAAGGLELIRKESDVIKSDDSLGKMPPQEREPFTWLRLAGAPTVVSGAGGGVVGVPAQPAPAPAAVPAGPVPTFSSLLGTYVHKPNPFISETITIGGDGSFKYKDSNGASAAGVFSLVGDTLTITSGEVVRKFKASQDGKALTLNCAPDDAPRFKNDMASMSPTVLKTAKYEKQ